MALDIKPRDEGLSGLKTLAILAQMSFFLALGLASVIWGASLLDVLNSRSPTCEGNPFAVPYRAQSFFAFFFGPAALLAMVGFWAWPGVRFLAALHERLRMPKYERMPNNFVRFKVVGYVTLLSVIWDLGALALTCGSK